MAVFFIPTTQTIVKWHLVSVALQNAYTDFILSRQAMLCTPATMEFYIHTAGKFLSWLERQGMTSPQEVTARYVRQYLAELADLGRADNTIRDHARAKKKLLRFWHTEKYIPEMVTFATPKVE
jgi:site-specific recombinase XerD